MIKQTFHSTCIEDTDNIAKNFSKSLKGGEVIFAKGDLGAGKTMFFKSIGKYLNVKKTINSPTFNLVKKYEGDFVFYHVDCYRFEDVEDEKKELGIEEEIQDKSTIVYIEWPEFLPKAILNLHPIIKINFEIIDENERNIEIIDER